MRRLFLLLPLALLLAIVPGRALGRYGVRSYFRHVYHHDHAVHTAIARLEALQHAQGTAFPPDSLAQLGAIYSFCCYGDIKVDTARGLPMLREAVARGSRLAPLYLSWRTSDSLQKRALVRLALRRGNPEASWFLAFPFMRTGQPLRADSLVLLAREARRYGADAGAYTIERKLVALDSMANLGHPQADSLRADLKQKGLWEERFSASI